MSDATEPTRDEIKRAKRWASLQSPAVTVQTPSDRDDLWFVAHDPQWLWTLRTTSFYDNEDAAWSALAIALRPVFQSIGPVVAAEERERCASKAEHHPDCDMQMAGTPCNVPRDIAAAIRGMKT